jgi:hypothetical protein
LLIRFRVRAGGVPAGMASSRIGGVRGLRVGRDILIIAAIAAAVAFVPGGSNAAQVVLAILTLAFLGAIVWFLSTLRRENHLTLAALSDGRRAILYGALGLIALLISGTDTFFASSGGTLLWIVLLGASVAAIWRVWLEAKSY